jgi:AraC-like DNA-binding protein
MVLTTGSTHLSGNEQVLGAGFYRIDPRTEIEVEECGCAVVAPPWKHDERTLKCHVLLLGLRGQVGLIEGGDPFVLEPGRVLLLRAGVPHRGLSRLAAPARYLWVHFRANLIDDDRALPDAALIARIADLISETPVERCFRDLLTAAEETSPTGWKAKVRFLELLVALTDALADPRHETRTVSQLVYRVRSRIVETLDDPDLSVKGLAHAEGVSPDYLSRQFKTAEGVTVSEYISRRRVERSIRLLEETHLAVPKVAAFCGFGSDRQFSRVFRRQMGLAPGEFRQLRSMMHVNDH